ncbi:hypothetical protein HS088_TW19G00124 [Tripterygium wilfordii]|uniref:Stigma-specific Stig1 family protein n=1 Tax=Tripterygium wilfordii TaxID=458696 RepID=A0A7J7C8R9_TRIWF|nr:stigma-specific STIG1-like protein 3 [Tripterygium wilfordii]KAF5730533.1 hypothetical protein HS088_TW19G00124 [Tripterygium wilfordii]
MGLMKILLFIAITMALSLTLTMRSIEEKPPYDDTSNTLPTLKHQTQTPLPSSSSKRVSRFLAENKGKNPRAADHCHKDNQVCQVQDELDYNNYRNATCCNNKCVDLGYDDQNCGACKKKCKFTQACCRGECVYLSLDKRHCGGCHNRCPLREFCVYGMCEYA